MSPRTRSLSIAAVLILFAAAALRLVALGQIPPGLPFEEASLAAQALQPPALLSPGPGSHWITYLMAGSLALFGKNLLGVRLVAAFCGLLTVALTYRWVKILYRREVALVASALMAASFWPLFFSRIGLEAVTLPPLLALANWLYARALSGVGSPRALVRFALAGLAVGAALYSPPGGWLVPTVFAGLYLYYLLARRELLRASPPGHLAFWAMAAAAGLPLVLAQGVRFTPQMEALTGSLASGDAAPLLDALDRAGSMWAVLGDGLFHYNVGHWPVFNIALATVFVVGLFYPIGDRVTQPAAGSSAPQSVRVLILAWLAAGVVASALIDPERAFTMGIIAMPAAYIVLALGFDLIGRLVSESASLGWLARRWGSALAVIVLLVAAEGVWSYFVVGPNDPQAQGDYRTDLFRLARDLRGRETGGLAISTNEPHNVPPLIFEFLPHGSRPVHWFDASVALAIPASPDGSPAEVDIPEGVEVNRRLEKYLGQPSTAVPGIRRYEITSGAAFLKEFPPPISQRMWVADIAAFPPDDPDGVRRELDQSVWFGDIVELVGYQSDTSRQAGKPIRIALFWRVLRDVEPSLDLSMFAHLLSADGQLAAQTDRLSVPSSTWRGGDIFIQIQDIPTDQSLASGLYHLQIGLYHRADGQRLPVFVAGESVGDRLLLEPVEITSP